MGGPSTFYSSGNLMYAAYDMKDGKTFVAKNGFDWVLSNNGACEVVTSAGHVVPATCETKAADGGNTLNVEYQVPGKVRFKSDTPEPTKESYLIEGNHLLPSGLVRSGRYDKQ